MIQPTTNMDSTVATRGPMASTRGRTTRMDRGDTGKNNNTQDNNTRDNILFPSRDRSAQFQKQDRYIQLHLLYQNCFL